MKQKFLELYYTIWVACYGRPRWYYALRAYIRSIKPTFRSKDQIETAKLNGHALNAMDANDAAKRLKCNHQKGGTIVIHRDGSFAFPSKGCSNNYAVIKHQHIMGDIWIECLRCGRKWKPPIRSDFKDERTYYKAFEEYEFMKDCPTNNSMSCSVQCRFALNGNLDAGREYVRKQMANS